MSPTTNKIRPRRRTLNVHPRPSFARNNTEPTRANQAEDVSPEVNNYSISQDEAEATLYPLRDLADRVGRQIEIFAEILDSWKPKDTTSQMEYRTSAFGVARDLCESAQSAVEGLKYKHGHELREAERKRFKQRRELNSTGRVEPELVELSERPETGTRLEDLQEYQEECHTWNLFERLLHCRYLEEPPDLDETSSSARFDADGADWQRFLFADHPSRERSIIVKWLEDSANVTDEDITVLRETVEEGSSRGRGIWAQGWIDTKQRIKAQKRMNVGGDQMAAAMLPTIRGASTNEPLVYQLDPDAPNRQKKTLEDSDMEFEKAFWLVAWEMLRRGKSLAEIRNWCYDCNEATRAITMGATTAKSDDATSRFRWRKACRRAATSLGSNVFERAVVGLLGGDAEVPSIVGLRWEDYLYVQYTSVLIGRYERFILENNPTLQSAKDHYAFGNKTWDEDTHDIEGVATRISRGIDRHYGLPGSDQPQRLIQLSLITHNFEDMMVQQGVQLARLANQDTDFQVHRLVNQNCATMLPNIEKIDSVVDNHNVRRVLAHLHLIMIDLGTDYGSPQRLEAAENILLSYIEFLLNAAKMDLIPLYVSKLKATDPVVVMAQILPTITNGRHRQEYLRTIESFGIEPLDVLVCQYELYMELSNLPRQAEKFENTHVKLHQSSRNVNPQFYHMWPGRRVAPHGPSKFPWKITYIVRAMEWFMLIDGHWFQAFSCLEDVAKHLLLAGWPEACAQLVRLMSPEEVSRRKTQLYFNGRKLNLFAPLGEEEDDGGTPISPEFRRNDPLDGPLEQSEEEMLQRAAMRRQGYVYYELAQLVRCLEQLWEWRVFEDNHMSVDRRDIANSKKRGGERLSQLLASLRPLLQSSYLSTPTPTLPAPLLHGLRRIYLPSMIIATYTATVFGAQVVGRDRFLDGYDIATEVAANDQLIEDFKAAGKMTEFVNVIGRGSKILLDVNEQRGKAKNDSVKGFRSRLARSTAIWDIKGGNGD